MLLGLPLANAGLQDGILARRLVDHVADPGVPARLDVRGVVLLVLVVDPARAERQFLRRVLEVPVPVAVGADEAAGFGVAWQWRSGLVRFWLREGGWWW